MSNRMIRGSRRSTLLIGSALAAMLAGAGIATAQAPVDNPPGATFESQGNRQGEGIRENPSPYSRTRHSPEIGNPYRKGKASAQASTSRRHTKKHQTH
jgi:hypothetical protein